MLAMCLLYRIVAILLISAEVSSTTKGYTQFPEVGKAYKFHQDPQRWHLAARTCRGEGGRLAMPKDQAEANILVSIFSLHPAASLQGLRYPDYVLIGFHDAFVEGTYLTENGDVLANYYNTWKKNQPDNAGNEDCGSLHRTTVINDIGCLVPCVFICELSTNDPQPTPPHDPASDRTYTFFKSVGKYYKFHRNHSAWHQALATCRREHAELALPNSVAEVDVLKSIFSSYQSPQELDYWLYLGFHDAFVEGELLDVKGNPLLIGYNTWGRGQPDNHKDEDCGSLGRVGELNDVSCVSPRLFICQKNALPAPETPTAHCVPDTAIFMSLELNRQYSLHLTPRNWTEADRICRNEMAWLAVLNSNEEAELLKTALALHPEAGLPGTFDMSIVFVGLSTLLFPGMFTNSEGILVEHLGYNVWSPGHSIVTHQCGGMRRDGDLAAVACDSSAMFFCEKRLRPDDAAERHVIRTAREAMSSLEVSTSVPPDLDTTPDDFKSAYWILKTIDKQKNNK